MTKRRASYRPDYSAALLQQLEVSGITGFVREVRFHPVRRWRWDLADKERMIAVEIQGATWTQGKHTRGTGYDNDCRKYCEAACMGWLVLAMPATWIDTGLALQYVEYAVRSRAGSP
jgi:hypothetical protein